jgi:glutamine amidotransferase
MMITIVDYGMGNLGSLINMFKRIGVKVGVESDPEAIVMAEKIILPGVGAFDAAMHRINSTPNLRKALDKRVLKDKVPTLGICLGMQLLTNGSEEGGLQGLGWIRGSAIRFKNDINLKVPHMGWNHAVPFAENEITKGIEPLSRYYFVHSYYVKVDNISNSLMRTTHGVEFDSAIWNENIFGVQFHPEKSHRFGMQILKNFAGI